MLSQNICFNLAVLTICGLWAKKTLLWFALLYTCTFHETTHFSCLGIYSIENFSKYVEHRYLDDGSDNIFQWCIEKSN